MTDKDLLKAIGRIDDWLIEEARKNDMAVKFCITPFDWKD